MAHRYFLSEINGTTAKVLGEEAVHLCRVMRIKPGDELILCDRVGFDYECRAVSVTQSEIIFDILGQKINEAEPKANLTVYMALPKSDKLEFIVQKMCELGVKKIVPFVSEFCVAQKSKKEGNKQERLQRISDEACKQSGRSSAAEVCETLTFKQLLTAIKNEDKALLFYENSGDKLCDINLDNTQKVGIIIGSEGGFSQREADILAENGAIPIGLGKRILRCETAAVVAAGIVMYRLGELE
ncbi:MAG: RsmE family RNA methyltransferase [Oscillospiraceae bacterium]